MGTLLAAMAASSFLSIVARPAALGKKKHIRPVVRNCSATPAGIKGVCLQPQKRRCICTGVFMYETGWTITARRRRSGCSKHGSLLFFAPHNRTSAACVKFSRAAQSRSESVVLWTDKHKGIRIQSKAPAGPSSTGANTGRFHSPASAFPARSRAAESLIACQKAGHPSGWPAFCMSGVDREALSFQRYAPLYVPLMPGPASNGFFQIDAACRTYYNRCIIHDYRAPKSQGRGQI